MELDESVMDYFGVIQKDVYTIQFTSDKKNSLYIPLFISSIEHCFATHLLDKNELTSSAFALARPMVESYLRAMWVKHVLDETNIEEGCTELHFPNKPEVLLNEVGDAVVEADRFHNFKLAITPIISNMHDFTHGGVQSIARQYNDEYLSNNQNRAERDELLKLAILTSSLSYENLKPFMNNSASLTDVLDNATKLLQL